MGFFGSFWGSDQRKDIQQGYQKATNLINQGASSQDAKYNEAGLMYKPYIDQGTKANTLYDDMIGINGTDAQRSAYGMITSNPLYQNSLDQQNNAMLRYMNSRGNSGGAADLAAQRVFQQNMGNWMDRYRDAGTQGLKATTYGADINTRRGDNYMGTAATNANNTQNYYNALAGSRNIGINNLFKIAELGIAGAKAAAGKPG